MRRSDRSVGAYFERALRRPREKGPEPAVWVEGEDGLRAAFHLRFDGARLEDCEYRCTTCATLIAFCEALREAAIGLRAPQLHALTPAGLLRFVEGVPLDHRSRATLALNALHAATRKDPKTL